ncbi:conserved Plasmodium protein, unknown function [Plasmodium vivax]|uniref:Uncharacterized protein n=1 Tax=Plasmodium vivax TaxID=5855 RepID=A0A1G4H1R7_PLAVI|nr:conserved Plasmodium protein, unknown function [Plasmodium vivax]
MDIHHSREGAQGTSRMGNEKAQVREMLHEKGVASKGGAAEYSQARTAKGTHLSGAPKEKPNIKTVIHSSGKSFKTKIKKLKKKYKNVHTVSNNNDEHVKALLHIHHSSHHGDTDEEGNSISLNNVNGTKYVCAKLREGDQNGVNLPPNDEAKTGDPFRRSGENFINSAWPNHKRSNGTLPSRVGIDSLSGFAPVVEGDDDAADDTDDVSSQAASEKCDDSPSENLPPPHVQKMDEVNIALGEKHSRRVNHINEPPNIKHSVSCSCDEWSRSGVEEDKPRTPVNNIGNTNDEIEGCRTESSGEGNSRDGGSDGGGDGGSDDGGEGGHPEGDAMSKEEKAINEGNLNEPLMGEGNVVEPHEGENIWGDIAHVGGLVEGEIGTTSGDHHAEEDGGELGSPPSEERFSAVRFEARGGSHSSRGEVSGEQVSDEMSVAGDVQQQGGVENGHGEDVHGENGHDENGLGENYLGEDFHGEEARREDCQGEHRQRESYPLEWHQREGFPLESRPNERGPPPTTAQEEKFDLRNILTCNVDTFNGGQGEMEKLNRLISFRDNAEKYLQSYINSFLNDFFLMSSYLPYLHYYDENTYGKKEMNFLKIVTHFMDLFHCNKKMSKKIRDFKNDFVNSSLNEKIKYVDKFPFLKLPEVCTDRVKGQFLKLLKEYCRRKKKKKKKNYYQFFLCRKFVNQIFKLKEKWVENNFLQIGFSGLGPPAAQQKRQQGSGGEMEERHEVKAPLGRPLLKESTKEEGYLFHNVKERSPNGQGQKSHHQMGEKWHKDIFYEQIVAAPFLKEENISNGDFTKAMKTKMPSLDDLARKFTPLSDAKKMEHASGFSPPQSKHSIRKHLNPVVRNELFNVFHLTDAKYREKIYTKNEDRHIINNISFYKHKINRLYAYLMACALMGHSPNFTQPHISWSGASDVRGDPREDLQVELPPRNSGSLRSYNEEHTTNALNEKDRGSPNRCISLCTLIKIANEFVKNNGGSSKGGGQKNKTPLNSNSESLSKDMDILASNFLQDGAYNSAPRDVGQNAKRSYISTPSDEAKRLNSFPIEWGVKNVDVCNGKGALEGLANRATCVPRETSKLGEAGNESPVKWEEVSGGGDLQRGPREGSGRKLTSALSVDGQVYATPDERRDPHLPVKEKKTDDKFQLSPDLQLLYDAYNNGEQIIVLKNKNKLLHNSDKGTKFTRLSKHSPFHANDSWQSGVGPSKGTPPTVWKRQMGCMNIQPDCTYVKNTHGGILQNENSSAMTYPYDVQTRDSNMPFLQNGFFRQRHGEGACRGYSNKGSLAASGATSGNHTISSNDIHMNGAIEQLSKFDKVQNRVHSIDSNNILVNTSSGGFTKCRKLANVMCPQYAPGALHYINGVNAGVQSCSKVNLKSVDHCANGNNVSGGFPFSHPPLKQQPLSNYLTQSTSYMNQFDDHSQSLCNQMGNTHPFIFEQMQKERSILYNQNGYPHFALTNNYFADATNPFAQNGKGGGNICGRYYHSNENLSYTHQGEQNAANNVGSGTDHINGSNQMEQPCVYLPNGASDNRFESASEDGTYSVSHQHKRCVEQVVGKDNDGGAVRKGNDDDEVENQNGCFNDVRHDPDGTHKSSTTGGECKGGDDHTEATEESYPPRGMNALLGEGSKQVVSTDVGENHQQCHGNDPTGDEQGSNITTTGEDHLNRNVKGRDDCKEECSHSKGEGEKEPPLNSNNNSSQNSSQDTSGSSPGEENAHKKNHPGDNWPSTEGTNLHAGAYAEGTINGDTGVRSMRSDNHDGSVSPNAADSDADTGSPTHQKGEPSHEGNPTSEELADPLKSACNDDEYACSQNLQHLSNPSRGENPLQSSHLVNNHAGHFNVKNQPRKDNSCEGIANVNTGAHSVEANGDDSYHGGSAPLGGEGDEKSINFNEMGAPMDYAPIRGDSVRSAVGGSGPLNSHITRMGINKSNQMNSITFSIDSTGNETKYKITEEMVSLMRQTDAYRPPRGHYQGSDADTSMASLYKPFSFNGMMMPPYHNARSNVKNYPSAEMRSNINVHNYNMNKNENAEMANDCLGTPPPQSNLPTNTYGYPYSYNMGSYFLNGVHLVGLENRTGERPARNNLDFANYNGMLNECCDGEDEEWDPQQEGLHREGPHPEDPLQDDDRSGGSFPSSSSLIRRDKTQKEKKKNANMNTNKPQPFGLNACKKKKIGNSGPPTAEKLSELLHEKNLSVPQIAAIYGVHRTTVARWCYNRKIIQKSSNYQGRKKSPSKVGAEYA